jgi:hypothetical protein
VLLRHHHPDNHADPTSLVPTNEFSASFVSDATPTHISIWQQMELYGSGSNIGHGATATTRISGYGQATGRALVAATKTASATA